MRLPSENILDVLHCVDFAALLALQRAASGFFDVIRRNQSLLPRLRVFHLHIDYDIGALALREAVGTDNNIVLESSTPSRFAEDIDYSFVRTSRDAIGTHFVHSASIVWTPPGRRMRKQLDMRKLVDALPALKHVRALSVECGHPMNTKRSIDTDLLERLVMKPFDNLQCLRLCDVDNRTDWAFLRNEWALRLRSLTVEAHVRLGEVFYESEYPEIDSSGQAKILKHGADFVHLPKGTSKLVGLVDWRIPLEFLERLVKVSSHTRVLFSHHFRVAFSGVLSACIPQEASACAIGIPLVFFTAYLSARTL